MVLDSLNALQRRIAADTEGYVRVIASAGSGKTRVLTSRYLHLTCSLGVDTDSILCVTFTRKAMNEMKKRVRERLNPETTLPYILTYHSFGSAFLREEIEHIGFSKSFRIYDEDEQEKVFKQIVKEHGNQYDELIFEDFLDRKKEIKEKMEYIPSLQDRNKPYNVIESKTLMDKYVDDYLLSQRKRKWLDFDDLIFFTLYILKNEELVLNKWQDKFSYILVDEAQDTSKKEAEIIELLAGKCNNLFIVGDPDQNIYEWRDSYGAFLLNFNKRHKCKEYIMDTNYRSTQAILDCSNSLIKNNKKRIDKEVKSAREKGAKPLLFQLSEKSAVEDIVKRIVKEREEGTPYRENAVLFRCQFLSLELEKAFSKNKIPYSIAKGVSFFQRVEIKDAIAFIKLICFLDDAALLHVINKPSRKFGKKKVDELLSMQEKEPLYKTLHRHMNDIIFSSSNIQDFVNTIDRICESKDEWGIKKTIVHLFEDTGYNDYLLGLKDLSHYENLKRFLEEIDRYSDMYPQATLEDYYSRHLADLDETEREIDSVQLMTIHAAKGLEFKNVYLYGFNKDIIPHKKTVLERGIKGVEEERRLTYVAMTRAKERLCIYSLNDIGFYSDSTPSPFLNEIKDEVRFI